MINLCILKTVTGAFTFTKENIWFLYPYIKSKKMCGKITPGIPTLIFLSIVLPSHINLKLVFLILIFVVTVYVSNPVVVARGF